MYTLDTNAIIYYLHDDFDAMAVMQDVLDKNTPVYISTITEIELFGFPRLNTTEVEQIERMIKTLSVIPVDSRIARLAGEIRKTYGLPIADSIIAATALFTGSTLLTRNIRDFKKIQGLILRTL
ncbi:MAG: type II toxin-antitoxin system VapC family toxin [Patescibacteria group bacterium]